MPKRQQSEPRSFGKLLRRLREARNMSIIDLADASGIQRTAIHRLEAGGRLPSWDTVCRLADALDASLGDFSETEEAPMEPGG